MMHPQYGEEHQYLEQCTFPKLIQIQTMSNCNGRCLFCPYNDTRTRLSQGKMDDSLYKRILYECQELCMEPSIHLMLQNEPFLDTRLFDFIGTARRILPKSKLVIVTNGTLLNERARVKLCRSPLDVLEVSIHTTSPSTYSKIMPNFNLSDVLNNVEKLVSMKPDHMEVRVLGVKNRHTEEGTLRFIYHWRRKGVQVEMRQLSNRIGGLKHFDALKTTDNYRYFFKTWLRYVDINSTGKYHFHYASFYDLNIGYSIYRKKRLFSLVGLLNYTRPTI